MKAVGLQQNDKVGGYVHFASFERAHLQSVLCKASVLGILIEASTAVLLLLLLLHPLSPSTLCYLLLTSLYDVKVNRFFFHSQRIRIGNIEREILRAGWQINLVSLYEMCHTHKTWSGIKKGARLFLSGGGAAAAFVPSGTLDLFARTKGLS